MLSEVVFGIGDIQEKPIRSRICRICLTKGAGVVGLVSFSDAKISINVNILQLNLDGHATFVYRCKCIIILQCNS